MTENTCIVCSMIENGIPIESEMDSSWRVSSEWLCEKHNTMHLQCKEKWMLDDEERRCKLFKNDVSRSSFYREISLSRLSASVGREVTLADVAVVVGIFKSVTQARKNGWEKPIQLGKALLGKKRIAVEIVP